uniref:Uncharacterized protein n=1 Tax=Aquila chrysaetos chrysaetos TaxID=223781 RepID=A0A663ENE1_AQUCH
MKCYLHLLAAGGTVPGWKAAAESCVSKMPFRNISFLFWPREKELAELKQQVDTLKSSIAKEEERVADLKLKVHLFSSGECKADDQDKMLTSLNKKVLEVYCDCTGENEANLQTVQMLMVIEKQLNDLLDNLEKIPPAKIEQAEKAKKKERRISFALLTYKRNKTHIYSTLGTENSGKNLTHPPHAPQIKSKTNQTKKTFKEHLKFS